MGFLRDLLRGFTASPASAPPPATEEADPYAGLALTDLRHLEATSLRLRGMSHYVEDEERGMYGGRELVLQLEPDNEHDSNAIAVLGKGRKLGYVSAAQAARLAPLLRQVDCDGFIVGGSVQWLAQSTQVHVMLPRIPVLRSHIASLLQQ